MALLRHQGFRTNFCGRSCGKKLTACTAQCTSALPDKCGPCSSGLQNISLQQGPADPPSSQNPRSVEGLNLSPTKSQGCDSSVHTRSLAGVTSVSVSGNWNLQLGFPWHPLLFALGPLKISLLICSHWRKEFMFSLCFKPDFVLREQ